MQNVVLIALVLVIVIFAVYQYNPSVFRFMRRDGFANMMGNDKKGPMGQPMADAHGAEQAGQFSADGFAEMEQNGGALSVNPVPPGNPQSADTAATPYTTQPAEKKKADGFADLSTFEGPANFGAAEAPAGCYPRDQLTPAELLPKDMNSIWAEQNPMGPGSLKGKNFLSAGALIGVNTVGQSLRNANLQIRSEPPNPQVPVSIFLQSTIGPDISHRTLEIN
jgi:hypothetical protein